MSSLYTRSYGFLPLLLVASTALLGCTGSVVSPGEPGAVAAEADQSSGAGGSPTSTGGGDCDALAQIYEDALTAAAACNACGTDGCSSGPVYPTPLGCNVILNFDNLAEISAAKLAYWAWRDAGCVASQGTCESGPPTASCAANVASSCAGSCTPPPSP